MNNKDRIIGLRKLIKERYQENAEYSKILSQYEFYRFKFLEDIENQMDPAPSIFSTDSDSDSYDEENSESSSDASYCVPAPKKIKRSFTPDQQYYPNLEKSNDVQKKTSQSTPQLSRQPSSSMEPQNSQQIIQPPPGSQPQPNLPLAQFVFQNPTNIEQLNNLIKKLFSNNFSNVSQTRDKKNQVTIQNPPSISSSNQPVSPPATAPQRSKSAPTPIQANITQNISTPSKESKHFLYPSNVTSSPPPPIYKGVIPGHFVLNNNHIPTPNNSNDNHKTFLVNDSKVANLISHYRKTLDLLQQQQFVNILHQQSKIKSITCEIVDLTYKMIQQNILSWKSNSIREKLELTDLDPTTDSYLNNIIPEKDEQGTNLVHSTFLKSKLSLWSKANGKSPDQFILNYQETVKPNEVNKLIDSIDIKSFKSDQQFVQDFIAIDELDTSSNIDPK